MSALCDNIKDCTDGRDETDCSSKNMRIYHKCEDVLENSVPHTTVWNHKACRVTTNSECGGHIILAHWTSISEILPWNKKSYLPQAILPRLSREGYIHWLYWNSRT